MGVTVVLHGVSDPEPYAFIAATDTRCGTPIGSADITTLYAEPFTVRGEVIGPGSTVTL